MTWLDNPITQMWGPYFLALYATVFGVLLALSWWHRRRVDQSMELGDFPIPSRIDPYQLAYLRGGLQEVLRLATVDLYHRGLIVDVKSDSSSAKQLHLLPEANLIGLDPPLRLAAEFYRFPRNPTELPKSGLKVGCQEKIAIWDRWIKKERLRHSAFSKTSHLAFQIVMLTAYSSLGLYKLFVKVIGEAHLRPHDVRHEQAFARTVGNLFFSNYAEALAAAHAIGQFGVLFLGVAFGTLMSTCILIATAWLPRFTERGRRFINNLQTAFAGLKRPPSVASSPSDASEPAERTDDAVPVLAMGLFGVAALQGGPLHMMYDHYTKAADAGSACGVGCGSSCGSGDGGGGCGGCGGGCGCGG